MIMLQAIQLVNDFFSGGGFPFISNRNVTTLYIQLGTNKRLLRPLNYSLKSHLLPITGSPENVFWITFTWTLIVSSKELILNSEYKFVCVHVCVFKCIHAWVCIVKARGQYQMFSQLLLTLFFWHRISYGTQSLLIQLDWLATKIQASSTLCLPSFELTVVKPPHSDIQWVLKIPTQPHRFVQQVLSWLSHLPSSRYKPTYPEFNTLLGTHWVVLHLAWVIFVATAPSTLRDINNLDGSGSCVLLCLMKTFRNIAIRPSLRPQSCLNIELFWDWNTRSNHIIDHVPICIVGHYFNL